MAASGRDGMDGGTAPLPVSLDARDLLAAWQLLLSAVFCLAVAVARHWQYKVGPEPW